MLASLFVLAVILLSSCTEELDDASPGFSKILGMESASNGSKIIERSNGDLMILGQTSVSAFDFSNSNGSLDVGELIESAVSITITDQYGNQKALRTYPISEIELHPAFSRFDIAGRGNLLDIIENSDGSYLALGEWRNIPVSIGPPWNIEFEDSSPIVGSFLMHLSPELDLLNIRSFNTEPGWDFTYYAGARMKKLMDGNILLLLSNGFEPGSTSPSSFRLLTLDEAGNSLSDNKYQAADGYKLARDFVEDENGNLVLIGQRYEEIVTYRIPLDNMSAEQSFFVDSDGVLGSYNNNMHYITATAESGFVVVYTDPTSRVLVNHLDDTFQSLVKFELAPENQDEYPRAVAQAENGDILIYTVHLAQEGTISRGYLYRVTREGKRIFLLRVDGTPGDVAECSDGTLLVLSNPIYNGLLPKATLSKISAYGEDIY